MAAVSLCPTSGAFYQAFTAGGLPLNAGLLYQYAAGGTTPTATYTTSAGSVQNANPIVLGADGRPPNEIWLVNGTAYRFDLYDANSNLIASYDNVSGIQASSAGSFLPLAGGTMTGNIAMSGTQKLTGLAAGSANGDSVRFEQSPQSLLSAKGGLISASAANTPSVLTVGSNGQVLTSNSNTTTGLQWGSALLRSYLAGCALSTAGGSGTMSIAAGTAVDSTNVSAMVLAAIAKTTSAWAVGTAQGGLDTGSIATATWYHFFVIQRVDTGVVDVLFSTSATGPTMPANYTLFRRIGAGLTDGSSHWTAFTQIGDDFDLTVPVLETTSANAGTNAITQTIANVPTGVIVKLKANCDVSGSASNAIISPLTMTDAAPSSSAAPLTNVGVTVNVGNQIQILTNTSAQIRYRMSSSGSGEKLNIVTTGWIDTRGRFN